MYDWLGEALADDRCSVVTANLRLSRILNQAYGEQQLAKDALVWKTPDIHVWNHWLNTLLDSADDSAGLATRLNAQQSRVLWERCVREEVDKSIVDIVSIANLGRMARDGWVRMHEWNLSLDECANAATGQDQRIFARTVMRYRNELHANDWLDAEAMPAILCELLVARQLRVPKRLTLCGFDRTTPQVQSVMDALKAAGTEIVVKQQEAANEHVLFRCENREAEMRAAGAWAAEILRKDRSLRVAVVVIGLDNNAAQSGRLLREGLAPGWQYGGRQRAAAVNVSYGRRLSEYPAIHAGLLLLRWLVGDIAGADISILLRSSYIGIGPAYGRSRLELQLRNLPDRQWSPARLLRAQRGRDASPDAVDWFARLAKFAEFRANFASISSPSEWAGSVDEVLTAMNWPGDLALDSADFQLLNRWRDLLSEFAQLQIVEPRMNAATAVSRIASMAGETLFQAETEGSVLSVMGPLEAAGMEFDCLWIAGLGADDWPPQGRPSPLLSRELQIKHEMPDSTPQDSADYARRVLDRLRASAPSCCLSYAMTDAGQEQLASPMLADLVEEQGPADPGWHAVRLLDRVSLSVLADPAPPLRDGEIIIGGASTINRQMSEPFAAFAHGRLGIRWMQAFTAGIAPSTRGNLVHDALFRLYEHLPTQKEICGWNSAELGKRIAVAVDQAFERHERHTDSVLRQIFKLERRRTETLLASVVAVDRERSEFAIGAVERSLEGRLGPLKISLRGDRIDELDNSEILILDYKTGATKKFLTSGEPRDMQLVVYACISDRVVAGLGLFNVDSKLTAIDGAGPAIADNAEFDEWQNTLEHWKQQVVDAASDIASGDVRVSSVQDGRDARPLNLLSRFPELEREL